MVMKWKRGGDYARRTDFSLFSKKSIEKSGI